MDKVELDELFFLLCQFIIEDTIHSRENELWVKAYCWDIKLTSELYRKALEIKYEQIRMG